MTPKEALDAAIARHRQNQLGEAERLYRLVLTLDPAEVNALRLLGLLSGQTGRGDAAVPWLRRAIAVFDGVPEFHLNLQRMLDGLGRPREASAAFIGSLRAQARAAARAAGQPAIPPDPRRWDRVSVQPPGERDRPVVLFVSERWFLFDPGRGQSNGNLYGIGALSDSGLGDAVSAFVDEAFYETGRPAARTLAEALAAVRPDLVVFTPQVGRTVEAFDPTPLELAALKSRFGFRLAVLLYDMADDWGAEPAIRYADALDVAVAIDLPQAAAAERLPGRPVLGLWAPPCPRLFFDDGQPRDIPVSFVGQVRQARAVDLDAIRAAGVDVHVGGGQRGDAPLSFEDYAGTLRRSRMTINFSGSQSAGRHHVKARVFEALACGTLLLESENPVTPCWLEPGRHYVPYRDARDLADTVRHFLAHPEEARAIAAAGRDHVARTLTGAAFWSRLLAFALPG